MPRGHEFEDRGWLHSMYQPDGEPIVRAFFCRRCHMQWAYADAAPQKRELQPPKRGGGWWLIKKTIRNVYEDAK
jgi:hypothetical protein